MNRKIIILVSIAALQCGAAIADRAAESSENVEPTLATATNNAATTNQALAAVPPEKAFASLNWKLKRPGKAGEEGIAAATNAPAANDTTAPEVLSRDSFVINKVRGRSAPTTKGWLFKDYLTANTTNGNSAASHELPGGGVIVSDSSIKGAAAANGAPVEEEAITNNVAINGQTIATHAPAKSSTVASASPGNNTAGKGEVIKKAGVVNQAPVKGTPAVNDASARSDMVTADLIKNVIAAPHAAPVKKVTVMANPRLAPYHSAATPAPAKSGMVAGAMPRNDIAEKGGVIKQAAVANQSQVKGKPAADGASARRDMAAGKLRKSVIAASHAPQVEKRNVMASPRLSRDHPLANDVPVKSSAVTGLTVRNNIPGKGGGIKKVAVVNVAQVKEKSVGDGGSAGKDLIAPELIKNVMAANNASINKENAGPNGRPSNSHLTANHVVARQNVAATDGRFKNYLAANNSPVSRTLVANNPPLAGTAAPGLPAITLPGLNSGSTPVNSQIAPGLPMISPPADGSSDTTPPQEATPDAVTNLMYSQDDQYRLGPGDTIVYQVIEDQDAPTNLVVTDSGDLEVPYYGLVHAAGKTCQELADEIKSLLQKNLYYRATVVIALGIENKNWVTGKVYVTGQVKNPGSYPILSTENMTVSKAILAAGGFSDFSDQRHVRLIKQGADGNQTYVVNVVDVWKGDLNKDLQVQPGDMVVVPARLINY